MLNLSKRRLQRQDCSELIQQLIGKHALKIWCLTCSLVLFIGALALVGLLNPGFDPTDVPANGAVPTLSAEQSQKRATTWKMALLILVSTVGAGAIAYHLKYADWLSKPSRPHAPRQNVKRNVKRNAELSASRSSTRKAASSRGSNPKRAARTQSPTPRSPQSATAITRPQPVLPTSTPQASQQRPAAARSHLSLQPQSTLRTSPSLALHRTELKITVVPAETVMPLDRRQPSLAELMDLRKRYTITSIIGGTEDL